MGDILTFEPRTRAPRPNTTRADAPGAQILFFLGVRYAPYVETPPILSLKMPGAKPRPRPTPSRPPGKKRPA